VKKPYLFIMKALFLLSFSVCKIILCSVLTCYYTQCSRNDHFCKYIFKTFSASVSSLFSRNQEGLLFYMLTKCCKFEINRMSLDVSLAIESVYSFLLQPIEVTESHILSGRKYIQTMFS
jgi:hypothetical protein